MQPPARADDSATNIHPDSHEHIVGHRHRIRVLDVTVHAVDADLQGTLALPENAEAIVVFVHGSGSSRFSPRNRLVAETLNEAGFATLLFDLLTPWEAEVDERTRHLRFDIPLLARRTIGVIDWLARREDTAHLKVGLFGASTGAAAALIAAAQRPECVGAVVSRGGRPDLAGDALPLVKAPTLLIVGGADRPVITLNREAAERLECHHRLELIPDATHLFEEPGAMEQVTEDARLWFREHLAPGGALRQL